MQTILNEEDIITDNNEILKRRRMILYNDLLQKLSLMNTNKKLLLKEYNNEIYKIDKELK